MLSDEKIGCGGLFNSSWIQCVDFKADVQIDTRIHIMIARDVHTDTRH